MVKNKANKHFVRITEKLNDLGYLVKWVTVDSNKNLRACLAIPMSGNVGYPIVSTAFFDLDYKELTVDGITRASEIIVDCKIE